MGTFVEIPSQVYGLQTVYDQSKSLMTERFDTVNDYADQTFELTQDYIDDLDRLLNSLAVPDVGEINVDSPEIPNIDYAARPSLGDVALPGDWPVNTAISPAWTALPVFTPVTIPTLTVAPPAWSNPDTPTADSITPPGDMPAVNQVTVPTPPTVTLPTPPTLDNIAIPSPPSTTLPVFDTELPSMTIDYPAPFAWGEPPYNSDIWADLLAKVLDGIRNGGTGLDAAVEAEIYQRLLDRQQDENERLYNEANDYFAARGFTLPPGALSGRLNEINQQVSRNNSAASREITINQAELAQKNTHFIIDKGAQLEGMLREFYTSNTNRLFEVNRYTAQNAIDIYNAMVEQHNGCIRAYEAEAKVYEARVRAAMTEIEIFKGQVEAASVTADVQKNLVDIYKSQLSAAETQMNLFVAEMNGARIASEIEMTKLEQFKLETQAYIARLDGEKAKFSLYETQVKAEEAKARTYGEQVRAYAVEVDAAKAQLDVQIRQSEFVLEQNKQEVLRYQTELEAYKVELQAKLSETEAVVSGFQAETAAYNAETQAVSAMYQAKIQETQARIDEARFNMQKAVAEVEATVKGYVAIKELQVEGTSGIMNVGAQLTASALNAVNASASFGFSGSMNSGESWGHSESISESHSFDETKTS
jgi:hypothetical protein